MISIPRSILRTFRAVARRAGRQSSRAMSKLLVAISAGSDGCRVRAALPEVAIEYRLAGQFEPETILLPIEALNAWEGRGDELVTLEQQPECCVLASWSDRGVPRQVEFRVGLKDTVNFPDPPTMLTPNEPGLWSALRSAAASTDHNSTRYALSCLHFRGSLGRIDATDGGQILAQSGFQLGFEDDVASSEPQRFLAAGN